ncbi:MAG: hypothetical protein VZQ55_05500 [Ruminococcus sp.]|nr:hypothetical protein [Ruminococcus sp.]
MKFDKFLKKVSTYGQIVTVNGDSWLVCAGVGMIIPSGVINLLGVGKAPESTSRIVEALVEADKDDKVELIAASIKADGRPKDIVRIFGDPSGVNFDVNVGISNNDFGLLEKSDVNLAEAEIIYENDENKEINEKYLMILDYEDELVGFIQGVKEKE